MFIQKKKLKIPSRCRSVYYCNVECQRRHWKKGGHKRMCKEPALDVTAEQEGDYPGMFPLIDRDLPGVDDKILSLLSPADLARAKSVCKKWYSVVHKNMRVHAEIVAAAGDMATR